MKKFIFFLSVCILTCTGSNAYAVNYQDWIDNIIKAGDELISAQNNDGSFDWKYDGDPTDVGSTNIQGATARGLVAAYKQTGLTRFLDAANNTADWIINNNSNNMYNKDIEFLYELAESGGTDYRAQANTSAVNYINSKMTETGAATGADAIYERYAGLDWAGYAPGVIGGLKYWMIGEWGDVGHLLGDTVIYTEGGIDYTGHDMAMGIGTLMSNDYSTFSGDPGVDPHDSWHTLGYVGMLEGMAAGIGSGGTYANLQEIIDALAARVEDGTGTRGWQSLGYATYALGLFKDDASLLGADILAGWIEGGHFAINIDDVPESHGEALMGLARAPIPEPATALLVGIGLLSISAIGRKRRIV